MHGLSVRQKDHPKVTTFRFQHLSPAPYAPVELNVFSDWRPNRPLDPFVPNQGPIGAGAHRLELGRSLHVTTLTEVTKRRKLGCGKIGLRQKRRGNPGLAAAEIREKALNSALQRSELTSYPLR